MPHTLSEIFTHAHLVDFKNRNSWAGRGYSVLVKSRAQRSGPDLSGQRCCKLRLKLLYCRELLAKKKAVHRVCHCKEVGLQEWPLAGRASVPRVLYSIGLRMSLRRRTILFYGHPLASPSPVQADITGDRTVGRRFVREEVRIW